MGPLQVDFWDVDQGDCSVIRFPDGSLFIVDVGPRNSPLLDWLVKRKETIKGIVLTHNDEDHAGSLSAILDACGQRILQVFLIEDRNMTQASTRKIVAAVGKWRNAFGGIARRLEIPDGEERITIHQCDFGHNKEDQLTLYAVHPEMFSALEQQTRSLPNPNVVSGVLCLDVNHETKFIWGGDAPMEVVASTCEGKKPSVLMGPHHGGPIDRKKKGYDDQFEKIHPETVYISVGTCNKHDHPVPRFIELHRRQERRAVVCSQLQHCDRKRKLNREHVLHNHLVLGLGAPTGSHGVTCRGPMRYTWSSPVRDFLPDVFSDPHAKAVKGLHKPLCLGGLAHNS
ncbi:MAG: MBL fold metallo-hydrolase [Kiritimatiellia bacterium]